MPTFFDLTTIEVQDKDGNTFNKHVRLIFRDGKAILSFGWPIEYDLDDLSSWVSARDQGVRFYLDAGGRNHYGSPVFITYDKLKVLVAAAIMMKAGAV